MLVKNAIETPEGTLTFDGELTAEELAKTVEVGLTVLIQLGILTPNKEEKND